MILVVFVLLAVSTSSIDSYRSVVRSIQGVGTNMDRKRYDEVYKVLDDNVLFGVEMCGGVKPTPPKIYNKTSLVQIWIDAIGGLVTQHNYGDFMIDFDDPMYPSSATAYVGIQFYSRNPKEMNANIAVGYYDFEYKMKNGTWVCTKYLYYCRFANPLEAPSGF